LTDEDVQRIPAELREELGEWVLAARSNKALEIETPDATLDNVIVALGREAKARRERAIDKWLAADTAAWFDAEGRLDAEVAKLADDPRIAADRTLREHVRAERDLLKEVAEVGLQEYARLVPELERAVRERYDVRLAALDHYANAIAAVDEDGIVLRAGTPEYEHTRFDDRRAPSEHAFAVLDRLEERIKQLPKPNGIEIVLGRIQRYRRAVLKEHRGSKKWCLDEPVTVVTAKVASPVAADRVVVVLADEEDRRRFQGGT
jgi:hypothetical protein